MEDRLYNPLKLSVYRPLFSGKRVLICGAGAVGSNVAEALVKMGCSLDLLDFDKFTLENAAKHSCLVRTPEDVGQNKARCVARRVQPFLEEGCTANGMDTDLCRIGPEALADYDVVVLCLDNYATKALFNELWMQLPPERRPVVIMNGTKDEMARSVMLDGREFCLRCLMDERWLENGAVRTSCSGPQLRTVDGETVPVRTSRLASEHVGGAVPCAGDRRERGYEPAPDLLRLPDDGTDRDPPKGKAGLPGLCRSAAEGNPLAGGHGAGNHAGAGAGADCRPAGPCAV